MGRTQSQQQTQITGTNPLATVTEAVSYSYNLDGSVKEIGYPSGNTVTYTVGGADRVTQVSDSNNVYASQITSVAMYAPNGALANMASGATSSFAGIVTSNVYNDRLQPILLSANVGQNMIFGLCYDFHLGASINTGPCGFSASIPGGDNGNVFQVVNAVDSTRSAAYSYDALNRIQQAQTENTSSSNCWGESYTIDGWGNLTNIDGLQSMPHCKTETAGNPVNTNNQITSFCYDGAGNVLDTGACAQAPHTYVYDAEGRLQSPPVSGVNNGFSYTYFYDGDGHRVQKCTAAPCPSASTGGTLYIGLGLGARFSTKALVAALCKQNTST